MQTLNEIIEGLAETFWGDISVEELDANLPSIYDDDNKLHLAFVNLVLEIKNHNSIDRGRILTRLNGDVQILEIAWNGQPLSDQQIMTTNNWYIDGMGASEKPINRGSRIAAFFLLNIKGK